MDSNLRKLKGANMGIDLATPPGEIHWEQDRCPWNVAEQDPDIIVPPRPFGDRIKVRSDLGFLCIGGIPCSAKPIL